MTIVLTVHVFRWRQYWKARRLIQRLVLETFSPSCILRQPSDLSTCNWQSHDHFVNKNWCCWVLTYVYFELRSVWGYYFASIYAHFYSISTHSHTHPACLHTSLFSSQQILLVSLDHNGSLSKNNQMTIIYCDTFCIITVLTSLGGAKRDGIITFSKHTPLICHNNKFCSCVNPTCPHALLIPTDFPWILQDSHCPVQISDIFHKR